MASEERLPAVELGAYGFNLAVLWLMTALPAVLLHFRLLTRLLVR
ncbi:MAG: hypothetical protein ACYC7J_14900 [Syntrophales bacterium]